MENQGTATM